MADADRLTSMGGCIASGYVASGEHPIRFFYRDDPVDAADTGWCFLSGIESDDYMDDASNQVVLDVATIVRMEPAIEALLYSPIGSAFEREDGEGPFEEVHDWTPERA